jgi:hypothetical protein
MERYPIYMCSMQTSIMHSSTSQVVEGLTHVAQMVSHSNNWTSFNRFGQDRSSSNNRGFERMKCWYHKSDAHEIGDCSIFAKLDSQTKIDMLRKTATCAVCKLLWCIRPHLWYPLSDISQGIRLLHCLDKCPIFKQLKHLQIIELVLTDLVKIDPLVITEVLKGWSVGIINLTLMKSEIAVYLPN